MDHSQEASSGVQQMQNPVRKWRRGSMQDSMLTLLVNLSLSPLQCWRYERMRLDLYCPLEFGLSHLPSWCHLGLYLCFLKAVENVLFFFICIPSSVMPSCISIHFMTNLPVKGRPLALRCHCHLNLVFFLGSPSVWPPKWPDRDDVTPAHESHHNVTELVW